MRLKLGLRPISRNGAIPINYQYPLSAAIYKILSKAAPDYADFLHDRGYAAPSGRLMKMFTFSKLWIPKVRMKNDRLYGADTHWSFQIASPMQDEFVQNFVLGLFESQSITIAGPGARTEFLIETVETLPVPDFAQVTRFKSLSPFTASTMQEKNGKLGIHYYSPTEPGLAEALENNLVQKYQVINGKPPENNRLLFKLEKEDKPRQKLVTIKEGTSEATKVKAFETYFTLTGSAELKQTAWECGLGEHNSQGFGMIDAIES